METHRFAGANGLSLAARVGGSAEDPVVVLLPGSGQTSHAWDSAAKALVAAGRYVVSLDLRGHGDSDWAPLGRYALGDYIADLLAVLPQLPSPPAIVGAALGGTVALCALGASGAPLATALVLLDVAPRVSRRGLNLVADMLKLDVDGFASVEEAYAAVRAAWPDRSPPDLEDLRRHLRRADSGRFRWHWDPAVGRSAMTEEQLAAYERRCRDACPALDVPTLIVRGGESELLDQRSVDELGRLIRDVEFATVPGVGHRMLGERNDAFNSAIVDFLEKRARRPGAEPRSGVDGATLRGAMGCFATGVTVITTRGIDGEPLGFTANSFTSVSLDPPLVLFCIKREAASVAALRGSACFAVNVLHIGQQAISTRFASRIEDRFAETDWEVWDTGVPIIRDAMANFECSIDELSEGGDHFIVIGRVRRVMFDEVRDPLLFLRGKYRQIHVAPA